MNCNADFKDRNVLVCGLARSGYAAAKLLLRGGARVCVSDSAAESTFTPEKARWARELEAAGADLYTGQNPDGIIRGFGCIVISPGIPSDTPFILKAKSLGIPVIGELELGCRACKAPLIAVTGTNGKTTATTLAGEIMSKYKPGSETLGNIGTAFCEKASEIPASAWAVLEISSFQLELVHTFRPEISAVLNISEDHLNRHYTMENYISVKEKVFKNQNAVGAVVLNYDDEVCRKMAERAPCRPAYFSSYGEPGGGRADAAPAVFLSGSEVYYRYGTYYEKLWDARDMRIPFKHILEDAMAAALITVIAGAPVDIITDTVLKFRGVPHRMEYAGSFGGTDYYNDSKATNVDSAIKALESIEGRVIIIGGGQDKNADFSPWVRMFPSKAARVILMGETAGQIIAECEKIGFRDYTSVSGIEEAVKAAKAAAVPGGMVLFSPACASLDMFKDYEERGNQFKKYVAGGNNI